MELLQKLKEAGYRINLDGSNLRLTWQGRNRPDPATVGPLLEELSRRKQEAIDYLSCQHPASAGADGETGPVVRPPGVHVTFISGRPLEFRKRLKLVRKRTGHVYRFKRWEKFPPPVIWERQPDGDFRCLRPWEALEEKKRWDVRGGR